MFRISSSIGMLCLAASSSLWGADWKIDPAHSSANFSVRHMMVSTVHGSFNGVTGAVAYDAGQPSAAKANITINTTTLDTRDPKRDEHVKSADFLDVQKYPTMTFVSKSLSAVGEGKMKLVGNLTIHGVTKEATFDVEGPTPPVKDQKGNLHVGASATTKINRKDYGINWNKTIDAGGAVVGDEVLLTIELELIRAAA